MKIPLYEDYEPIAPVFYPILSSRTECTWRTHVLKLGEEIYKVDTFNNPEPEPFRLILSRLDILIKLPEFLAYMREHDKF